MLINYSLLNFQLVVILLLIKDPPITIPGCHFEFIKLLAKYLYYYPHPQLFTLIPINLLLFQLISQSTDLLINQQHLIQ